MTKKNFLFLVLTVVGGLLFALGMCMCLLPEWNAFRPGVVVTGLGLAALLAIGLVRWVMAGKPETRQAILQTQRDEQMEAANQRKAEAEDRIRKAQGK